jgi:hypothetical protein
VQWFHISSQNNSPLAILSKIIYPNLFGFDKC